jgi:multidrug transporter EmrE-like cation transporter
LDATDIKPGFPVSFLLVGMIYTGSKALQYLSIPVYTIFKNLTIIITAYGEVLWFGGSVTRLTLFSFGLIVLSSVVAAWADISHALSASGGATPEASAKISTLNAGYMWMMINCFCTTSYVLGMRKRIKITNFKDFDSKSSSQNPLEQIANRIQPCSTTTSLPSQSSSSRRSWQKTGRLLTSTTTSLPKSVTASSLPLLLLVS